MVDDAGVLTADPPRMTPVVRLLLAAVAITIALLVFIYAQTNARADRLDDRLAGKDAQISELAGGVDALRSQVLGLGEKPVAPAAAEVTHGRDGRDGAPGSTGPAGRDGFDGFDGVAGMDGLDGLAGRDGVDGEPGAPGAPGEPGPAGPAGEPGPAGEDSTVPGPQGEPGSTGATGAPGPACPDGYEPRVIDSGPYQGWIACAPVGDP